MLFILKIAKYVNIHINIYISLMSFLVLKFSLIAKYILLTDGPIWHVVIIIIIVK
jgi:hypothetical protein